MKLDAIFQKFGRLLSITSDRPLTRAKIASHTGSPADLASGILGKPQSFGEYQHTDDDISLLVFNSSYSNLQLRGEELVQGGIAFSRCVSFDCICDN